MKKPLLPALLLLLALVAAIGYQSFPIHSQSLPEELFLTFTDGTRTQLRALRGRPLLLAFWSVNCPLCLQEIPKIAELHRLVGPNDISVIAVNIPQDPPPAIMATVRRFQPSYPTALDVQGEIARAVGGVDATPLTLFVDRQGRIVRRVYGELDLGDARSTLESL